MPFIDSIKNIKTKYGKLFTSKNIAIIFGILFIISLIFLFYMSGSSQTNFKSLEILQTENKFLKKDLTDKIDSQNKELVKLNKANQKYIKEIQDLNKKFITLQENYANVKPPKDKEERIKRYNALGYHPR